MLLLLLAMPAGGAPAPDQAPSCTHCHSPDPLFSHRVDFVPRRRLPEGFPLENGRMTCATCHDSQWPQAHARARQNGTSLLRGSSHEDFCANCHKHESADRADLHAHAIGRAHLRWPEQTNHVRFAGSEHHPGAYISDSQVCMSCHDGFIASSASGPHAFATGSRGNDHPVAIDYSLSDPGDADAGLHPASTLDPRIRLFANQVECESCHSLYAQRRAKLVMAPPQSDLCLSCHAY